MPDSWAFEMIPKPLQKSTISSIAAHTKIQVLGPCQTPAQLPRFLNLFRGLRGRRFLAKIQLLGPCQTPFWAFRDES